MDDHDAKRIADLVRQTAYEIHLFHGHGHLEKIYENALVHRLKKLGLRVQQQIPIEVIDEDGTVLGKYLVDLLVEGTLLVEIKAAKRIAAEHTAQLLGYLKSFRLKHGVLINFGSARFEIRKYAAPTY
jgi:GxxExxY protein